MFHTSRLPSFQSSLCQKSSAFHLEAPAMTLTPRSLFDKAKSLKLPMSPANMCSQIAYCTGRGCEGTNRLTSRNGVSPVLRRSRWKKRYLFSAASSSDSRGVMSITVLPRNFTV